MVVFGQIILVRILNRKAIEVAVKCMQPDLAGVFTGQNITKLVAEWCEKLRVGWLTVRGSYRVLQCHPSYHEERW